MYGKEIDQSTTGKSYSVWEITARLYSRIVWKYADQVCFWEDQQGSKDLALDGVNAFHHKVNISPFFIGSEEVPSTMVCTIDTIISRWPLAIPLSHLTRRSSTT